MGQKKLKRFAEIASFAHVWEYPENTAGEWSGYFKNDRPITLELACGKGEYTIGRATNMPRRYFYDTVLVKKEKGRDVNDTVWHKIRPFKLKNQFGKEVGLEDWGQKIIVVDFFFTSCPSVCPTLTRNMKRLQDAFKKTDTIVRFVSFTVDPERDSVAKIKAFGDKYQIDHDGWWMLTGDKKEIYDLALNEFKASIASNGNIDTGFIHTEKLFLLDRDRVVRGWYNGLDSTNLDRVIKDVVMLSMERDKKRKRNLFRK